MHIFNITFQSVAALLAIGLIGFWIIKRHLIPENILQFLAVLAIEIALPCVVFANIITHFSPHPLSVGGNIRCGGWHSRRLPFY
jgi:predicted permease